ncbi:hypothetical protein [Photobacterium leiognathi]|uniref:hypothetical protein n=1 Tax=Photobacterium leiognathi TaxID=553611 RepID=UPI002982A23D|nr:hypothetical protein [Photobacterium leiognathi]
MNIRQKPAVAMATVVILITLTSIFVTGAHYFTMQNGFGYLNQEIKQKTQSISRAALANYISKSRENQNSMDTYLDGSTIWCSKNNDILDVSNPSNECESSYIGIDKIRNVFIPKLISGCPSYGSSIFSDTCLSINSISSHEHTSARDGVEVRLKASQINGNYTGIYKL